MAGLKKQKINLISRFRKSSIFVSHLKRFLAIIVIPLILLNLVMTIYYYRVVSLESKMSSIQIFSSAHTKVESLFKESEEIFLALALEEGMNSFMEAESMVELSDFDRRATNELAEITKKYCIPAKNIDTIQIYSKKADYVISSTDNGPADTFSHKPWYDTESDNLCYAVKSGKTLSLCYNILSNHEKAGLVVFGMSSSEIRLSALDPSGRDVAMTLTDADGNVLFSMGEFMGKDNPDAAVPSRQVLRMYNKYTRITDNVNGITMTMEIRHSQPFYSNFVLVTILFAIIVILLSVAVAFILASFSYKTVHEIVMSLNDSETVSDLSDPTNEIMYINQNILSMKDKAQRLEEELLTSFATLKALQTQVLQAQFTPHFLFNVLNTLNLSLMLKNGHDNPESKSLVSLSELLNESIDTKNYMVTMANELEYCRKYVDIQSYISNSNFDVVWDIDAGIEECIYIKFTLQPLIENAFKHGIKYLKNKKKGLLIVSARRKGNLLQIKIRNNGPEIDAQSMQNLNRMLSEGINHDRDHIGLFNVNKRIKLVFGESYGCSISSEDDLTAVTVITPFVTDFGEDTSEK